MLLCAQSGSEAEQSLVAAIVQQGLEQQQDFRQDHSFAQMSTTQPYSHFKRYSPFYLRSHPMERATSDIADIQMMSMQTTGGN